MQQAVGVAGGGGVAQDDFVRAVLLTFDPSLPSVGLKAAAVEYCDRIVQSADGWRLCLQKLHEVSLARGPDQVIFWCLLQLYDVVSKRYAGMSEEEKTVMRRSLMLFVRDVVPVVQQSSFIKNKLCTILVLIIKHDYPNVWPTFFTSVAQHAGLQPRSTGCCERASFSPSEQQSQS